MKPPGRVARLSGVLELRRAIPFLAFPIIAFALAVLISGCGSGATATISPSPSLALALPSPTLGATITPSPDPTAKPDPSPKLDRISRNRAKWSQAGIDTYRLTLQYGCFCEFGNGAPVKVRVVDGKVVEATVDGKPIPRRQRQGFPMTVEALFDRAEAAKADADKFEFEFDKVLGYPTMINVDEVLNGDDDEFRVDVTSLIPAS